MMPFKFKLQKWAGLACAVAVLCYSLIAVSQSPQPSVQLITNPPIAQAFPLEAEATEYLGSGKYEAPVQLKFQARDKAGAPLQNAQFQLEILTPPPTPWFTTDFPLVEGTKLLNLEGNSPTGAFQVEQVFPIRGNYELRVSITPVVANAFVPIQQTLSLTIPENPLKLLYFPVLLAVLLAIGLAGGWIIGSRQEIQMGEIAPRRVRLLLSSVTALAIVVLLLFNVSAEFGEAHAGALEEASTDNPPSLLQSQGLKLALQGADHAVVGQTTSLQAILTDSETDQPVSDAIFDIKAIQIENNWVAFGYQGVPNAEGKLAWQEQFFDGAPHRIEVNVSPNPLSDRQFQPFQVTKEIEVEGIVPPLSVRLIGLLYFTSMLALGVFSGLWLQHHRLQNTQMS